MLRTVAVGWHSIDTRTEITGEEVQMRQDRSKLSSP